MELMLEHFNKANEQIAELATTLDSLSKAHYDFGGLYNQLKAKEVDHNLEIKELQTKHNKTVNELNKKIADLEKILAFMVEKIEIKLS